MIFFIIISVSICVLKKGGLFKFAYPGPVGVTWNSRNISQERGRIQQLSTRSAMRSKEAIVATCHGSGGIHRAFWVNREKVLVLPICKKNNNNNTKVERCGNMNERESKKMRQVYLVTWQESRSVRRVMLENQHATG